MKPRVEPILLSQTSSISIRTNRNMGDYQYRDNIEGNSTSFDDTQVATPSETEVGDDAGWSCPTCTFFNKVSSYLACEICGEIRPSNLNSNGSAEYFDSVHTPQSSSYDDEETARLAALEAEEQQRRIQEREAQVEREHQALVNARLEEIIEMQHKLFADHQSPTNPTQTELEGERELHRLREQEKEQARRLEWERDRAKASEMERDNWEKEREEARALAEHVRLMENEKEREQARQLEKEREQARLLEIERQKQREKALLLEQEQMKLQEEQLLKERQETLELQRKELEELKESITKSSLLSTSDMLTGEKHHERQRRQAASNSRPGATAVPGPGAVSVSPKAPSGLDKKYQKLDEERQQLEQRRRDMHPSSQQSRPGAVPVPGISTLTTSSHSAEHKLKCLEQERQHLLRQQRGLSHGYHGKNENLDVQSRTAEPGSVSSFMRETDASPSLPNPTRNQKPTHPPDQLPHQTTGVQEPYLTMTPSPRGVLPRQTQSGVHQGTPQTIAAKSNSPTRSGNLPPPPAPQPQQVQGSPSAPQRKSRMGLGLLMKRPSRVSRAASAPADTQHQQPSQSAGRSGRSDLRNSVAGVTIADLDQLIDDPSPVWEKSTKKR